MRAQHILVTNLKEAVRLIGDLREDTISFSEAARSFSICPSKKQCGDLGKIEKGQMGKTFEDACWTAKIGMLVGPVKTDQGFHIIRVLQK